MKNIRKFTLSFFVLIAFSGCLKQRFLPDPHNPGLNRLTDKQTNTGTCYINDVPYINYWPESGFSLGWGPSHFPQLSRVISANAPDSIDLSWRIGKRVNEKFIQGDYNDIIIRVPALQGATLGNFLSWNGKRFSSNECSLYMNYYSLKGTANIYFVKISTRQNDSSFLNISGLFDGNVGDSIIIKKGRFDYVVERKWL